MMYGVKLFFMALSSEMGIFMLSLPCNLHFVAALTPGDYFTLLTCSTLGKPTKARNHQGKHTES
jgi:hypothetical protein